jgi:hypothetical protein
MTAPSYQQSRSVYDWVRADTVTIYLAEPMENSNFGALLLHLFHYDK